MSSFYTPTKNFGSLARVLRYRKRKVRVVPTTRVTITDIYWSGGSRSVYHAYDLETGEVAALNSRTHLFPTKNPVEGTTLDIPAGVAVVVTGTFMGKPATMSIYARPENLPATITDAREEARV